MDLNLTREQELLKKSAREFAEAKLAPKALEFDEKGDFPFELIKETGQLGLLGLINSKEYGGSGMGHLARMIAIEETARIHPSLGFYIQTGNLFMYALENFGTDDQKKKYLPDLCKGAKISSLAVTEPGGGSEPTSMSTTATSDNGGYVVNGRKAYISHAGIADVVGFGKRSGDVG